MKIKNSNQINIQLEKMDEKIAIAWFDLTFEIKSILTKKSKIILNDVNGCTTFGSLNALMGPSGAGKTTLLKCINGKLKSGLSHRSKIYLSTHEKVRSCLIGQNQNQQLIRGLTAKQNLLYASRLKNSDNEFFVDHEKNVNNLLYELMTKSDIANTKIENCSGGEQRRITIALELTSDIKPNLICIDEPTSGLDSNAAEMVSIFIDSKYSLLIFFYYFSLKTNRFVLTFSLNLIFCLFYFNQESINQKFIIKCSKSITLMSYLSFSGNFFN